MSRNSPDLREDNNVLSVTETHNTDCGIYNKYNLNRTNGNVVEITLETGTLTEPTADQVNCNTTQVPDCTENEISHQITYTVDTNDLVMLDNNTTSNIIKIEDFKKVHPQNSTDDNFHCSTNSLNSENLSSPMQTSADVFLDSELLSTDITSNDSQSPKSIQMNNIKTFNFRDEVKNFIKPEKYGSNDSLSQPKSDQSLLNSEDSSDSSPIHSKMNRDYKKMQRKHKKKYFGVKTLQSIFNKRDGYSDISSTTSEVVDELFELKKKSQNEHVPDKEDPEAAVYTCKAVYPDTSPQFEENIHNILSDIFVKSFTAPPEPNLSNVVVNKPIGNKKYFSLHGQNLRVGKALRLCPNEDYSEQLDHDQRKEKLLARYVYNANSVSADGVGDPDFGTPV